MPAILKGHVHFSLAKDDSDALLRPGEILTHEAAELAKLTPERIIFPDLNCLVTFANFVDFGGGPAIAPVPGAPCPLASGADGVGFLFFGVALPRSGFTNGFVPPPAYT